MFWHEADGSVLPGTGGNFGFGTLPRCGVLNLYLRRWRLRRRLHNFAFGPCLFDLHITVELLERYFSRYSVDNEHTFLFSIVSLISLEHSVGHSGTI